MTPYTIRAYTPAERLLLRRLKLLAASREGKGTMRAEALQAIRAHLEREGHWGEQDPPIPGSVLV